MQFTFKILFLLFQFFQFIFVVLNNIIQGICHIYKWKSFFIWAPRESLSERFVSISIAVSTYAVLQIYLQFDPRFFFLLSLLFHDFSVVTFSFFLSSNTCEGKCWSPALFIYMIKDLYKGIIEVSIKIKYVIKLLNKFLLNKLLL